MRRLLGIVLPILAGSLWISGAHAQSSEPVGYSLVGPSSKFEWGCFGACACAVLDQSPLTGTFVLQPAGSDPLYTYYDVLEVQWQAGDAAQPSVITGSGTYRRGGEVALQEQLTLDLSFDGQPPKHFDSGLRPPGAPFPEIDTRVSLRGEICFDSVLIVDAKPTAVAGLDGGSLWQSVRVSPNPFAGATQIAFVLPGDAAVELSVYDLSGRRVRRLVAGERLPRGPGVRAWDGRLESGEAAPPGLYFVRLRSPVGQTVRTVVKLR